MTLWNEVANKLTDPTVIVGLIALVSGLGAYRRQLFLNRRVDLNKDFNVKLDELYQTLSSTITSYNEVINLLSNIGEKYRTQLSPSNPAEIDTQAEEAKKDVEKKYVAINKLIEEVEKYQSKGTEIINKLATDPIIAHDFSTVATSLNKEHIRIGNALGRANYLLIWTNPFPAGMTGGQNTSPQLFNAIRDVVNANVEDLKQFQQYVQDAKKLLHNKLVGGMFRKYKPAYTEQQRKVLTKKGIRDYTVETSRWLRLKTLVRLIWG